MKPKFATAINCIDGRVQVPVTEFIRGNYGIDYVDMITIPGPDKILSENKESSLIELIKRRMLISIEKHGSRIVVIAGHYDCAANPVEEKEHLDQIKEAVKNIKAWNFEVDVYGVWVDKDWNCRK
ncbi:MAG: hypothetical protein HQ558_02715 [Candidatus Omnitrophica bacterium]|nr:hypothetical protein [Candidatus Omnitrophota bacterium]